MRINLLLLVALTGCANTAAINTFDAPKLQTPLIVPEYIACDPCYQATAKTPPGGPSAASKAKTKPRVYGRATKNSGRR